MLKFVCSAIPRVFCELELVSKGTRALRWFASIAFVASSLVTEWDAELIDC